jgi:hypothetical protein
MPSRQVKNFFGFAGALSLLLLPVLATALAPVQTGDPSLNAYLNTPPDNAITRLQKDLDAGRVQLKFDRRRGYLPSVLNVLKIPVSSQTLVFSKTSFQHARISPRTPRALYFNDDVYVGWVPDGDVLEISVADPKLGAVFYTVDQSPTARPKIVRPKFDCIQCHQGEMTKKVPGHIMRSVYAMRDGQPDYSSGTLLTTDASPMSERWGGWYVTGKHGTMRHMGNATLSGESGSASIDRDRGANVSDLSGYFDTAIYPTPGSDIVALLVLQHQVNLHNLLTQANERTRRVLEDDAAIYGKEKVAAGQFSESARSRIRNIGEPLVRALLFADEPKWDSPVSGMSGFTGDFPVGGPKDARGRSLRQFDLKYRLFRYPCSFLIYSSAFDALPRAAKEYVYGRLVNVISGKETGEEFHRLTPAQRKGIGEILRETKPQFDAFWERRAASTEPDASSFQTLP